MAGSRQEKRFRVLHYVNQFFGGFGGEEQAYLEPSTSPGTKGPGRLLEKNFQARSAPVEIVGTIICGDSYFAENEDEALTKILAMARDYEPDLVVAGPAFNAGRYGMACGAICESLNDRGIPAITAMFDENPGLDQYRKSALILKCADTVAGMEDAADRIVNLAMKLLSGEDIEIPEDEGCFQQGLRKNYLHGVPAYRRAISTLLKKIEGEPFETEYPIPVFDRVDPRPAIADFRGKTVALVTSGGIVPEGNPDHIESSNASKYGRYSLTGVNTVESGTYQSAHGGYDNTYANSDPNRVLPLDMMRELEGEMGFNLYDRYYATVGNGTSVDSAQKFAKEIALDLVKDGVAAVILTST